MAITMIPGSYTNEYFGLSTDVKPTDRYMPNGSKFTEMDGGAEYRYDAENRKWRLQKAAGGGNQSQGGESQGDGAEISVSLSGTWAGSDPYTQPVTITGYTTTPNTRADIMADDAIVAQMIRDGVETIYIENDNNVFTAYAVGGRPSTAYNLTVVLTEVS